MFRVQSVTSRRPLIHSLAAQLSKEFTSDTAAPQYPDISLSPGLCEIVEGKEMAQFTEEQWTMVSNICTVLHV